MYKILLATDGSSGSNKAVEYAAKLCQGRSDAEVTVLYVKEPATYWATGGDPKELALPVFQGLEEALEKAAQDALASAQPILQQAGCKANLRSEVGRAAETICSIAERENFDQVVMGKRGLGAIAGLFVGSVSERVVNTCRVPVTVVWDATPAAERPVKFTDLYGLWKGKVHFTYEEIKEAEVRLPEDLR